MDTEGCPSGFSSDFTISVHGSGNCVVHLETFWIIIGLAQLLRFILTGVQLYLAYRMKNIKKQDASSTGGSRKSLRRFPFTTVAEVIHTLFNLIGWIFYGLNITDSRNGTGPADYMLVVLPMYIGFLFSCVKMVHLGEKVIPRKFRSHQDNNSSSHNMNRISSDSFLKIAFVMYSSSLCLATISMVILNTTINPGKSDVFTQTGFVLLAITNLAGLGIIVRQTERIAHHVLEVQTNLRILEGRNQNSNTQPVLSVISRMKFRSHMFSLTIAALVAFNLVGAISPATYGWELILATLVSSMITSFASTIMYLPRRRRSDQSKSDSKKTRSKPSRQDDFTSNGTTIRQIGGQQTVATIIPGSVTSIYRDTFFVVPDSNSPIN